MQALKVWPRTVAAVGPAFLIAGCTLTAQVRAGPVIVGDRVGLQAGVNVGIGADAGMVPVGIGVRAGGQADTGHGLGFSMAAEYFRLRNGWEDASRFAWRAGFSASAFEDQVLWSLHGAAIRVLIHRRSSGARFAQTLVGVGIEARAGLAATTKTETEDEYDAAAGVSATIDLIRQIFPSD